MSENTEFSSESDLIDHGASPSHVTDEDTRGRRVRVPVIGRRNAYIDFLQKALCI